MSGSAGQRGYLVQSLIALLKSLEDSSWTSVIVEPNSDSEKVDIKWIGQNSRVRMQVKSSQNTISLRHAKTWAEELIGECGDHSIVLQLVGPVSEGVMRLDTWKGVELLPPKNLDLGGLVAEASHRLSSFLERSSLPPVSPTKAEVLVQALTSRLSQAASESREFTRIAFIEQLTRWIKDHKLHESPELHLRDAMFYRRVPRNVFFAGREATISQIRRCLSPDAEASVSIIGLGGVGKSQLAIEYAYRHQDHYLAIIWLNLETLASLLKDIELWVSTAVGVAPDKQRKNFDHISWVRQWLLTHDRWLLVLDNVDSSESLEAAKGLFVTSNNGHYICTSRNTSIRSITNRNVDLKAFSIEEATQFLKRRTSRNTKLDNDPQLQELAQELGGLPLAIEQAAAFIVATSCTVSAYLRSCRRNKLDVLQKSDSVSSKCEASVSTTWNVSIEAIRAKSPVAYETLLYLAFLASNAIPFELFPFGAKQLGDSFSQHFKDFFPDHDELLIYELFSPLVELSLIQLDGDQRLVSIHPLVQEVTLASLSEKVARARRRKLLKAIADQFPPAKFENLPRCQRLFPHAMLLVSVAEPELLMNEECGNLLHRLGHYFELIGSFDLAESMTKKAIDVWTQLLGSASPQLGLSTCNLGVLHQKRGQNADAELLLRQAFEIRTKCLDKNDFDIGTNMHNLACVLFEQGKVDEAEQLLIQAISIFEHHQPTSTDHINSCRRKYAIILHEKGKNCEAIRLLREMVAALESLPAEKLKPEAIETYRDLANLEFHGGNIGNAKEMLWEAENIALSILGKESVPYANCLSLKGGICRIQKSFMKAHKLFEQAAEIVSRQLGKRHPSYAAILVNLADTKRALGHNTKEVLAFQQTAVEILEQTVGRKSLDVANAKSNLAFHLLHYGEMNRAFDLYSEVLAIRKQALSEPNLDIATAKANVAVSFEGSMRQQNRLQEALAVSECVRYYNSAVGAFRELGFPEVKDCLAFLEHYEKFASERGENLPPDVDGKLTIMRAQSGNHNARD